MKQGLVKWLGFTCLIGLLPLMLRLVIWTLSTSGVEPIAISDLIAFGLVLHATNINQVSESKSKDETWASVHYVTSIIFIAVYGLMFTTTVIPIANLSYSKILFFTALLSFVSLMISFAIFYAASNRNTIVRKMESEP